MTTCSSGGSEPHFGATRTSFRSRSLPLERRLALRNRRLSGRRTALLLAAAVGIGLLGVGGVVGGLLGDSNETAPPSRVTVASLPAPSTGPLHLGSLEELFEVALGGDVVIAQAHDHVDVGGTVSADVLPELASMSLGTISGSSRYQLTVACLGSGRAVLDIQVPSSRGPRTGPEIACDGAIYTQPISAGGPREIGLVAPRLASWRLVIRRLDGEEPVSPGEQPLLEVVPGNQELVRAQDQTIVAPAPVWSDSGLLLQGVGAVPGRWEYATRSTCVGGETVRLIFGHDLEGGRFAATTETLVPCDNGVHDASIGIPAPDGSEVYVAAAPETRWSILISGEEPPIALAEDQPGWQMQVGFGPHLSFDGEEHGFSAPGVDGGGPVLVVIACAGADPIEVTADVGRRVGDRQETFVADCTPDGTETGQSFELDGSYVDLTLAAPVGTWTAISILVPDPLPEGS
jgi:hypothetical protein